MGEASITIGFGKKRDTASTTAKRQSRPRPRKVGDRFVESISDSNADEFLEWRDDCVPVPICSQVINMAVTQVLDNDNDN